MGKRSLLEHMSKIGFDLNKIIDKSFKSMGSFFLPLPIVIDIFMKYMIEGVKIMFRYTYSIMKCHKNFLKKCSDP